MGGDMPMPVWQGLFEWSMNYQDGTQPSGSGPQVMAQEDRQWLEEALKGAMVDLGRRMQDITESLGEGSGASGGAAAADAGEAQQGSSLADRERLLAELAELVESIDLARDLGRIGGLGTLLGLLGSPHPSLRWRAAEVAATCMQNNLPVQQDFEEGGILLRLLPLLGDEDATVQTKGLLALSCLVRGHPPALTELRQEGGVGRLVGLLEQSGAEPRVQRKCLQLLQHMLQAAPADCGAAAASGLVPALCAPLEGEDPDVREAALAVARELASDASGVAALHQDAALRKTLQTLAMRLDTLPLEDWESVEAEVRLLAVVAGAAESGQPLPATPEAAAAAAEAAAQPVAQEEQQPPQQPVLALLGPPAS